MTNKPTNPEDEDEKFDVWQWFPDDLHEKIGEGLGPEEAVGLAYSYAARPAAKIGIIQRVTIVDSGDFTVFEWKFGQGVTFPPAARQAIFPEDFFP